MCCCNQKKQEWQKPEILKSKPEDCTPEQIRECHGEPETQPCVEAMGCDHPERLEGKPDDCSLEQIRQCHGDDKSHLCESRK